jgi:hypothetical protein
MAASTMTLLAQPDPSAIGPSVSFHLSRCERGGGYVVWVDGSVYAAKSTLEEAIGVMGLVAASQYQEPADPYAVGPPMPPGPSVDAPRVLRQPPQRAPDAPASMAGAGERLRATASLAVMALIVGLSGIVGV